MLIMDSSSHMSSKKLIISTREGKLGWREDQERIFHFSPGLILLYVEGAF